MTLKGSPFNSPECHSGKENAVKNHYGVVAYNRKRYATKGIFEVFGVVCFIKNKTVGMTLKGSHTNSPERNSGKGKRYSIKGDFGHWYWNIVN